jgi:hypothetical protein
MSHWSQRRDCRRSAPGSQRRMPVFFRGARTAAAPAGAAPPSSRIGGLLEFQQIPEQAAPVTSALFRSAAPICCSSGTSAIQHGCRPDKLPPSSEGETDRSCRRRFMGADCASISPSSAARCRTHPPSPPASLRISLADSDTPRTTSRPSASSAVVGVRPCERRACSSAALRASSLVRNASSSSRFAASSPRLRAARIRSILPASRATARSRRSPGLFAARARSRRHRDCRRPKGVARRERISSA